MAASNVSSLMLSRPATVFLIIGNNEYKITITIAGFVPIPNNGIINPNNAIDGMAWIKLAIAITGFLDGLK